MRNDDDSISRQDALSFLRNWERVKDYSWGERNIIKATINEIESLPSTQPEIIYCKDCKHYKAYEYTGKLACHYLIGVTFVRNLNDFCSRAERREE
jgi:hypothetical protein